MTNEWHLNDLSPISVRPETDWLVNVEGENSPLIYSLRLQTGGAAALFDVLSDLYVPGNVAVASFAEDQMLKTGWQGFATTHHVMLLQTTFVKLFQFLKANLDQNNQLLAGPEIELEIQADEGSAGDLTALINDQSGSSLLDVIPASRPMNIADFGLTDPAEMPVPGQSDFDEHSVITVIIDDGIGVANHRFRMTENTSRIAWFLDMNQIPAANEPAVPGRAFSQADLNALMVDAGEDDEDFYRAAGMVGTVKDQRQPLLYRGTHGTHILDLAAGEDYREPDAREKLASRPIIAVQLPSTVVADRSDARMAVTLKAALEWISEKAQALSRAVAGSNSPDRYLPMVVNFSFGVIAGPQDGEGDVERQILSFIQDYRALDGEPECDVVLAAGNSFQARAVAGHRFSESENSKDFAWRVKPDDKTSSFVQIWLPSYTSASQHLKVAVTPPRCGPVQKTFSKLDKSLDWVCQGHVLARLYHQTVARENAEQRERIIIAIRPTESDDDSKPAVCPHGVWKIHLENIDVPVGEDISLRVQRDDPVAYVRSKGRQSYFEDPDYVRFDETSGRLINDGQLDAGAVTRRRTLSAYTTGQEPKVIAGYRRSDGAPAVYSSSGPTAADRQGPDLAAVCEESAAHGGVLASGTATGSVTALNGTSVAAPQYTRHRVEEIAAQSPADTGTEPAHYPPKDHERLGHHRLIRGNDNPYRRRIDD